MRASPVFAAAGAALVALVLVPAVAAPREAPRPLLVNESSSLPRGLYLRRAGAPGRGAVVAAPPPPAAGPYLAGLGVRNDRLLLKRVAGMAGDRVCRHGGRVSLGRRTVRALSHDRRGAPLPAWSGCRRLGAGEFFLLGDTADSFDSRYFGPVAAATVTGVYREVLRW